MSLGCVESLTFMVMVVAGGRELSPPPLLPPTLLRRREPDGVAVLSSVGSMRLDGWLRQYGGITYLVPNSS